MQYATYRVLRVWRAHPQRTAQELRVLLSSPAPALLSKSVAVPPPTRAQVSCVCALLRRYELSVQARYDISYKFINLFLTTVRSYVCMKFKRSWP